MNLLLVIAGILNFKDEINEVKEYCNWEEAEYLIRVLADKIIKKSNKKYDIILGKTNGGIIPARLMARGLNIDFIQFIPVRNKELQREEMPLLHKDKKYLVIDEIYDTGDTFSKVYDVIPLINDFNSFHISLVSDDRDPIDLREKGHLNYLIRKAI
jgi:uncharacterized protein